MYKYFLLFFMLLAAGKVSAQKLRINGGHDATQNYTYQVSVQRKDSTGEYKHNCGGSIVNEEFVVTAAHCVTENGTTIDPNLLSILAGIIFLNDPTGSRHTVKKCIPHENYDPVNIVNDIALVKVTNPFEFNNKVNSIEFSGEFINGHTQVKLTGWGTRDPVGFTHTNTLQEIDLMTITNNQCRSVIHLGYWNIYASQICTQSLPTETPCFGDSGGPLVLTTLAKQVGIVSFGRFVCGAGNPIVFTRISYFIDWITNHLKM